MRNGASGERVTQRQIWFPPHASQSSGLIITFSTSAHKQFIFLPTWLISCKRKPGSWCGEAGWTAFFLRERPVPILRAWCGEKSELLLCLVGESARRVFVYDLPRNSAVNRHVYGSVSGVYMSEGTRYTKSVLSANPFATSRLFTHGYVDMYTERALYNSTYSRALHDIVK